MAEQSWKCLVCDKTFKAGDWTCRDGISHHTVTEKHYRSMDAPTDPSGKDESLRDGRTVVCNIPPPHRVEGSETLMGEGSVEFIRGRFSTSNPEQQYWLDKKPGYNATEDQWRSVWLSSSQKLELKEMELHAREQRIENEENALLAKTKERVAVGAR